MTFFRWRDARPAVGPLLAALILGLLLFESHVLAFGAGGMSEVGGIVDPQAEKAYTLVRVSVAGDVG